MASSLMSNLGTYLDQLAVLDFFLPFILVFTITFAILQKSEILGPKSKNFNVVVALVLGLLFVIPHITGTYPLGYDPVQIMNDSLPTISLVAIASIMVLLLLGLFNREFSEKAQPIIILIAAGFVVYSFGAALNWWSNPSSTFSWWTVDLTQLIIIILVFGIIVTFITKDDTSKGIGGYAKDGWDFLGDFIKPRG